jgi:hypothetical protein
MELKLPDLRIVDTRRLVLHEESDPTRSERIADRLREEKVLGNPPIVASTRGTSRLIVLDGANRVSAAFVLKLPALMVQVVDYDDPEVRLNQWHHLLLDFDETQLLSALEKIPGAVLERARGGSRGRPRFRGRTACLVRLKSGATWNVIPRVGQSPAAVMRAVTDIYKRKTQIYRIADEQIDMLADRTHANVTAVILFPGFRKSDIVRFALHEGEKLPPGITRHFIPNRALKVNLPLGVLRGRKSLAARGRELDAWIEKKSREKRIRAYPEPTVIFDE